MDLSFLNQNKDALVANGKMSPETAQMFDAQQILAGLPPIEPAVLPPGVDPAIQQVESAGNPNAISPKGAVGTHQVMPDAIRDVLVAKTGLAMDVAKQIPDSMLSKWAMEPGVSRAIGTNYYAKLAADHPAWSPQQVAAAYNGGPTRLAKNNGDISAMPAESQDYAQKVDAQTSKFGAPNMAQPQSQPATMASSMNDAFEMQQQAEVSKLQTAQQAHSEIVKEQLNQAAMIEQQRIQEEQRQLSIRNQLDKAGRIYSEATEKFSSGSVDPNRFFNNLSTGDKIVGALAIAIGGIAGGMNGTGKNSAMDIIDNAINRDIEAQKTDLEKKQVYAGMKKNEYNDLVEKLGNETRATEMLRAQALSASKAKLESIMTGLKSQEQIANAQQAVGVIEQKRLEALGVIQKDIETNPDLIDKELDVAIAEAERTKTPVNILKLPKEAQKKAVPGLGIAAEGANVNDIIKDKSAYEGVFDRLNKLKILRDGNGQSDVVIGGVKVPKGGFKGEVANRAAVRVANTLRGEMVGFMKQIKSLGALDAGVDAYVDKILPKDVLGFTFPGIQDSITTGVETLRANTMQDYRFMVKNNIVKLFPEAKGLATELPPGEYIGTAK